MIFMLGARLIMLFATCQKTFSYIGTLKNTKHGKYVEQETKESTMMIACPDIFMNSGSHRIS